MKREGFLSLLVERLITGWPNIQPTSPHSANHGWSFIDGQYVHKIHDPITIDDWNRAKIKPNTKIRIESPDHSEYVQKLAFEKGFKWCGGSKHLLHQGALFLFFDGGLISKNDGDEEFFDSDEDREIFIEMPKAEGGKLECVEPIAPITVEFDPIEKVTEPNLNDEYTIIDEPKDGFPFFDVKFDPSETENTLAEKVGSKHSHYYKDVSDLDEIDVYRVCDLFEVNDPSGAKQHAIKKLLCSGQRGAKDERKDLEEARDTIIRKLEMMAEDNQ